MICVISMEFLSLNRRRSSARNVPSGEERGETDVFAGYFSTAFHCIKAMFLTTDVFFNPLDIELQWSARIRTQYFDSRFIYILKVIHSQKTKLAIAITSCLNIVYFCLFRNWRRAFSWTWFSYVLLLSCFLLFLLTFLTVSC